MWLVRWWVGVVTAIPPLDPTWRLPSRRGSSARGSRENRWAKQSRVDGNGGFSVHFPSPGHISQRASHCVWDQRGCRRVTRKGWDYTLGLACLQYCQGGLHSPSWPIYRQCLVTNSCSVISATRKFVCVLGFRLKSILILFVYVWVHLFSVTMPMVCVCPWLKRD